MGQNSYLQPPASSRSAGCADQLPAYGLIYECGINVYPAASITNRGYRKKQACHDDRHSDPCAAKG